MNYTYTTHTNLNSAYNLPTGEARYEFAQFRTRAVAMTTRELYKVWSSNSEDVRNYAGRASLQFYCATAAARRDFAASILASRGMMYSASSDDFYR